MVSLVKTVKEGFEALFQILQLQETRLNHLEETMRDQIEEYRIFKHGKCKCGYQTDNPRLFYKHLEKCRNPAEILPDMEAE